MKKIFYKDSLDIFPLLAVSSFKFYNFMKHKEIEVFTTLFLALGWWFKINSLLHVEYNVFNGCWFTLQRTRLPSVPSGKRASMPGEMGEEVKNTRVWKIISCRWYVADRTRRKVLAGGYQNIIRGLPRVAPHSRAI